jgi:BirA family biotin operon repressor/biotin-[acetyl-CoA-carboxylase] ligase
MTARLDADRIRQPIDETSRSRLELLEVFAEIESTNSYLLDEPAPPPGHFRVALAEHQTEGRGRMARRWISPEWTGLCLSLAYTFARMPAHLPGVTLAVGTAVATAFEDLGIRGVGLKWPNDLILRDGKLGGILTEMRSAQNNATMVVVGVGVNVDFSAGRSDTPVTSRIGPATDLSMAATKLPSRNVISAKLIESVFNALVTYESEGLDAFSRSWERFDWLRGQRVIVETPADRVQGVAEGIDELGALIIRTANGRRAVNAGTVTLSAQGALH